MASYSVNSSDFVTVTESSSIKSGAADSAPKSTTTSGTIVYPSEEEIRERSKKANLSSVPTPMYTPQPPSLSTSTTPSQATPNGGVYIQSDAAQYGPSPYTYPGYPPQGYLPANTPHGPVYIQTPVSYPPNQLYPQYQEQPNYVPSPQLQQYPQQQYAPYQMQPQPQPQPQPQYMPPQPGYMQQQSAEQIVQCPYCNVQLYAPQGVERFRCTCGQVLKNPYFNPVYVASSSSTSTSSAQYDQQKKDKKKSDLVDAGLGIGVGLAAAATIGMLLSR